MFIKVHLIRQLKFILQHANKLLSLIPLLPFLHNPLLPSAAANNTSIMNLSYNFYFVGQPLIF